MISPDVFCPPVRLAARTHEPMNGISRLFAAALVNKRFREALLRDPRGAIQHGYPGQTVPLSQQERDLILSVRAGSLPELARQVNHLMSSGPWA